MKEIETKFKLESDVTFDEAIGVLRDRYGFEADPKVQHDAIYLFPEQIDQPIVEASKIARVRTVTKQGVTSSYMTLKVQTDRPLVSDEYEFGITNPETAEAFLRNLGLQRSVVVYKKRAEARVEDYTVCVDEVDKLGVFIELEALVDDEGHHAVERTQQHMRQFLGLLGLTGEISMVPYDTQVREYDRTHATN